MKLKNYTVSPQASISCILFIKTFIGMDESFRKVFLEVKNDFDI